MTDITFTAYSHLETFLLFQYLSLVGIEGAAFARISDLLKQNPRINEANNYDAGRLSPDALRDFYRSLLKEEVKSDLNHISDGEQPNGDGAANPRKRKIRSPSLPTVHEAVQKKDLLPGLIAKLYARYRQNVVAEIQEEERKYDRLKKEIEEIERGEWDNRFTAQNDDAEEVELVNGKTEVNGDGDTTSATTSASKDGKTPNGVSPTFRPPLANAVDTSKPPVSPRTSASIDALINPTDQTPRPSSSHQNATPPAAARPSIPAPQNPRLPLPQPTAPGYRMQSPSKPATAFPPPLQQPQVAINHLPQTQHGSPHMHGPTSPRILPPPQPGMFPPPPIVPPSAHYSPHRGSQGSPIQAPGYTQPIPSGTPPHTASYPTNGTTPTRTPAVPFTPTTPTYTQTNQQHTAPFFPAPQSQGGVMLQPFQVSPQDPTRAHQAQQQHLQQPQAPSTPHTPLPPVTPAPTTAHELDTILKGLASYVPKSTARRPQLTIETTTKWKPYTERGYTPIFSPTPSPVDEEAPRLPSTASETGLKNKSKHARKAEAAASAPSPAPSTASRPARSSRRVQAQTQAQAQPQTQTLSRRTRAGSVSSTAPSAAAPSTTRGRTRSQSVFSNADEAVDDAASVTGRKVKKEPHTPADTAGTPSGTDVTPTTAATTTRLRRGTVSSTNGPPPATSSKGSKRKRSPSPDLSLMHRPTHIQVARNFPRVSNPVMDDVSSHKHASLFSTRVKDKDAEGYSTAIKRPTDLKSIRSAIQAGSRAVTALASELTPMASGATASPIASTPTNASVTVLNLPIRDELMPPLGIVNSAQLERELMRMFANAVMFNPGEDGVVRDAREMFEAVVGSVGNWRAAERTRVLEETGLDGDMGGGKRRKVE